MNITALLITIAMLFAIFSIGLVFFILVARKRQKQPQKNNNPSNSTPRKLFLLSSIQKYSPEQTTIFGSLQMYSFARGLKYSLYHTSADDGYHTNLGVYKENDYPQSFIKEESSSEIPESLTYLPTIELRAEQPIQKYGKNISLISEIQTGSPEFDDNVFIYTTAPEKFVRSVLSSPQIQEKVLALLRAKWTAVVLYSANSPIQLRHFKGTQPEKNLEEYLDAIDVIYQEMPEINTKHKYTKMGFGCWFNLFLSFLLIPLIVLINLPSSSILILDPAFTLTNILTHVSLMSIATVTLFFLQRGTSHSLMNFTLSLSLSFLYIFLGTADMLRYINSNFDTSEQKTMEATITKTGIRHHDDSADTYYIKILFSLDEDDNLEREIQLDHTQFDAAKESQAITLFYREGYLGYQWLERFEITQR